MSNPDNYGDLLIEFDVEYPLTLNADQKILIKEALLSEPNGRKQSLQNQLRRKSWAVPRINRHGSDERLIAFLLMRTLVSAQIKETTKARRKNRGLEPDSLSCHS